MASSQPSGHRPTNSSGSAQASQSAALDPALGGRETTLERTIPEASGLTDHTNRQLGLGTTVLAPPVVFPLAPPSAPAPKSP